MVALVSMGECVSRATWLLGEEDEEDGRGGGATVRVKGEVVDAEWDARDGPAAGEGEIPEGEELEPNRVCDEAVDPCEGGLCAK